MEAEVDLELDEYKRYGRQMIVPGIGRKGQIRLKAARVLVIGAGGLGCPALLYLAGAGVGTLGIVDGDRVDVSNLHRQVLHATAACGRLKCESARQRCLETNPHTKIITYPEPATAATILGMVRQYDLVLDCTDNQPTRYLVSDACVIAGRPLVSGSALRLEGQLATYHYQGGPCYRCLFPEPSPAATVQSCADSGILGPVVGVIGVLQAQEAVKIIVAGPDGIPDWRPYLLTYSTVSALPEFRVMKLRGRKPACRVCGEAPSITESSLVGDADGAYAFACGAVREPAREGGVPSILPAALDKALRAGAPACVVDVRDPGQYEICALPASVNVPLDALDAWEAPRAPIYVLCRRGIDSVDAAARLARRLQRHDVYNVTGGLALWTRSVDPSFPEY